MAKPILRQLILHRFRSLPLEQVEFDNPTFLVGQNGSGKSNFADAVAFLAEAMTSPLRAVLEHRGGFSTVVHRSSQRLLPSRNLGLSVVLENPDSNVKLARYGFELRYRKDYGFEVAHEQCIVQRYDGSKDWFDRRTLRDSIRWKSSMEFLEPILEPYSLALPLIGGDPRFQEVSRFLSEMCVYRIDPVALRTMQDPDGGVRLRSDGSNAASVLREIQRESPYAWRQILEILESIVPGTVDVQPKRHGNKLMLEFTQDWAQEARPVRFEAFNMSDGTLRALGLLTAVFQHPSPSLLVIEEPEATIHPGALGSILDVLRHAGRFTQVVVTTHSPDVLDAKWIGSRHLRIVNCDKGATRISRVSPSTRDALSEHLMGAGELLRSNALTPADLFDHDPRQLSLFEDDLS